jgi:hypothetical protein
MSLLPRFLFCQLVLGLGLALGACSAAAQAPATAPRGYDFRTITLVKSPYRNDCRLLLTPAFEGKTELKLEEEYTLSSDKYREHLQANTALLNQLLSDLSVAGWELVETHALLEGPPPAAAVTRYLLRKAKN